MIVSFLTVECDFSAAFCSHNSKYKASIHVEGDLMYLTPKTAKIVMTPAFVSLSSFNIVTLLFLLQFSSHVFHTMHDLAETRERPGEVISFG